MDDIKFFTEEAKNIVLDLRESYRTKDMIATGKTVGSLEFEVNEKGFKVLGAAWINFTETGRPPRRSNKQSDFFERIEAWKKAKGINIPTKNIVYSINKRGTLLWQGKDRRFTGNKSGVISDVINDNLIDKLGKRFNEYKLNNFVIQLLNFLD